MGERVGFIGLGIMGKPMAGHLLAAGLPLTVHSRSPAPVDELVAGGAARAASPAEVAAASDVIITMLPDTPDVVEVITALTPSLAPGSLVIDMSSIDPGPARDLAAATTTAGSSMLDAPVSGGQKGAIEAVLSIMVGGDETAFARAEPILQLMGANVVHVGGSGAGQVTKACNQLVVAATIEAVAEALNLAERSGVDAGKVREALMGGFAGSKILEIHGQRMIDRTFQPGFRVRLHAKDARIVESAAAEVDAAIPSFEIVAQRLRDLEAAGGGELDHAGLFTLLSD